MDYEQKYKEALERAREFQKSKDGLCVLTAESIFPELQESEEEKIRKGIIELVKQSSEILSKSNQDRMLAWLEKQGKESSWKPTKEQYEALDYAYDSCSDTEYEGVLETLIKDLHRLEKQGEKKLAWSEEDERLRYSCIKHIEEELQEISKDKIGHSEIISDLKEDCRERINWLKSLKERLS